MRREALERLGVVGRDRLVGEVAARHHERTAADRGEQQVVERRVRQHDAELGEAVGAPTARGASASGAGRRSSTIGRTVPASSASSSAPTSHRRRAASRSGTMTASGLPQRRLRSRSVATAVGVGGVARQVEAAEALDREDAAVEQQPAPPRHDRVGAFAPRRRGRGAGAATASRSRRQRHVVRPGRQRRAGRRSGTAAGRRSRQASGCAWKRRSRGSPYSSRALRAHREVRIEVIGPVVGDVADDREARAAVRAVDERVAVAPVRGVEEFGEALGARGDVGGDERQRRLGASTLGSRRSREPLGSTGPRRHGLDDRHGRGEGRDVGGERVDARPARPRRRS